LLTSTDPVHADGAFAFRHEKSFALNEAGTQLHIDGNGLVCRPMTAYLEDTPPSWREPAGIASPTPNLLAVTPMATRTYAASPQAQV
jgi:hypothetical protein